MSCGRLRERLDVSTSSLIGWGGDDPLSDNRPTLEKQDGLQLWFLLDL